MKRVKKIHSDYLNVIPKKVTLLNKYLHITFKSNNCSRKFEDGPNLKKSLRFVITSIYIIDVSPILVRGEAEGNFGANKHFESNDCQRGKPELN